MPRYDVPMAAWCASPKEKFGVLKGYGEVPDKLIIPDSFYDSDCSLQLFSELDTLRDGDYLGNCRREPIGESMIAAPVMREIHRNGITVDRSRIDYLTEVFKEAQATLEVRFRKWADWTEFNIRLVQHAQEFLFGV